MTLANVVERLFDPVAYGDIVNLSSTPRAQSNWQFVIGPNNVGPQYELTMAYQRSLTYHIDDSATCVFSVHGDDPVLQYITELVTDLWVYRNGLLLFRGRIGSSGDELDGEADTYELTFNVFDYREWLMRQILPPSHKWSWRSITQAQIIRDLFTYTITNQSGIHPTFTIDTTQMPTSKVNFDITPGTSIKETIGVMAGFGWQVFPNSTTGITLKAMTPFYYKYNTGFIIQYGSTASKVSRSLDTGGYANSTVYTGDMNLAPLQNDAAGIASMPQGRLGQTLSNPSIKDKTHLSQAASSASARSLAVSPTWSCTLAPNIWNDSTDCWIGDICQFIVKKGRFNINDKYRITDMTININDDSDTGADGVDLTLVKPANLP
jgi:hypothetical protein